MGGSCSIRERWRAGWAFRRWAAGFGQRLRGFARAEEGVAAIEFAMILPAMLLIYLGLVVITTGIAIDRKVGTMAFTLADLTARAQAITNADRDIMFSAARAILAPYSATGATLVLTSIYIDDNGRATVSWSDANKAGAALTRGANYVLPDYAAGLAMPSSSLIIGEVTYPYAEGWTGVLASLGFSIGGFRDGILTMHEKSYMRPRLVPRIPRVVDEDTVYP
ncbi:TadE/TadG family type IV pilus assembly protein [Chelatococcus sp. GCM10030263]|uniref:TadE/TadG family type IV pilus assembly protein n=1 Tax=Chelatococcus sp. GCM10030263 TaxID=3273387 RepID=UPI00360DE5BC